MAAEAGAPGSTTAAPTSSPSIVCRPDVGLIRVPRIVRRVLFPEPLGPIVSAFFERHYHRAPTAAQLDAFVRTAEPPG